MDSVNLLFWLLFLINTNITKATDTNNVQNRQLNQILMEFCASEIDRNRTSSAILKFGQLPIAELSIKDVVQFHIKYYEETFDNLLNFINHIPSVEVQYIAYNTLIDAIASINVINALSLNILFE